MEAWRQSRLARALGPILAGSLLLALIVTLSAVGLGDGVPRFAGVFSALSVLLQTGLIVAAYLAGAAGLGRPLAFLLARNSDSRIAVQAALGLGAMLWLGHLLGVFGLLSGNHALPRIVAWLPVALGIVILLHQLVRGDLAPERWPTLPLSATIWAPAAALLLVAAANPPGWLWRSEHGAYDALAYHLQLPKEWSAHPSGIQPLEHNVYSYLPSYVESAYLQLGQMLPFSRGINAPERLVGGEGEWIIACQVLHTGLAILMSLIIARCVSAVVQRRSHREASLQPPSSDAAFCGLAAGAFALGVPWTIVTGSLAYNEMAVCALGAGALLLAGDASVAILRRGIGVGLLLGLACSAKPTALLLLGPVICLAFLTAAPIRARPLAVVASFALASMAALVAAAPWLIRNTLASGNPIFPFATRWFGLAHWTPEQVDRYTRAHQFNGSMGDRLALLFSADRGLFHPLWSLVAPIVLVSLLLLLISKPTRRFGAMLALGCGISILAWLFLTHLQSRFLVPLVVPFAIAFGAAASIVLDWVARNRAGIGLRTLARTVVLIAPLSLAFWSAVEFLSDHAGAPNRMLIDGPGAFTGAPFAPELLAQPQAERAAALAQTGSPVVFLNLAIQPALLDDQLREAILTRRGSTSAAAEPSSIYLLGDAAVLYYLAAAPFATADRAQPPGVIYHSTWDTSPLGEAIRTEPGTPEAWTRWLRSRGIGFVLINFDELHRLIESDHNYDPAVRPQLVRDWLTSPRAGCEPVQSWTVPGAPPGTGYLLVCLRNPDLAPAAPPASGSGGGVP